MTTGHETIQLRLKQRTAWITLDRPPLNILDIPMMQALDAVLERTLPKCDFVIFQGAGPKGFSAGAEFAKQLEEAERVYLSGLMQTHDAREGVRAFLEKRPPIWKGK